MTKATIWRVRRHIAVHNHRGPAFFSTKLHTSSSSRTSSGDAGRSVSATVGSFWICVLIQRTTVCRGIAKMRSTPRKLQRSKPARSTVCLSVSEEAGFGESTRYVPQSLQWYWAVPQRFVPFLTLFVLLQTRHSNVFVF